MPWASIRPWISRRTAASIRLCPPLAGGDAQGESEFLSPLPRSTESGGRRVAQAADDDELLRIPGRGDGAVGDHHVNCPFTGSQIGEDDIPAILSRRRTTHHHVAAQLHEGAGYSVLLEDFLSLVCGVALGD